MIHIWDRDFAGSPWTTLALEHDLRFILRWNKNYHLIRPHGRKHEVWKISPGKHSWEYRMIWDARRRCLRKTGVIALPVHLSEEDRPFSLVISRSGDGRKPWYLIASEPVHTAEQAWQIEMFLRFTKSEMAFESPHLQAWEARLKFLLIAALAYAFLLYLLANTDLASSACLPGIITELESGAEISAPLYHLSLAIFGPWLLCRPRLLPKLDSG